MQAPSNNKGVVLLSGGIDSTTTLAIALSEVDECVAVTFNYGQKHASEVNAAASIAARMGVHNHLIIRLPLGEHAASALTEKSIEVPKHEGDPAARNSIPDTYVPARNTIFLSYGLAIAETTDSDSIYIGVSSVDYSGYPDCRPEFIKAFQNLASVATERGAEGKEIKIKAPLQHLTKAETIRKGVQLGVDYSLTLSCYDPDSRGYACGGCDSCRLRLRGFEEADVEDPTVYRQV